MPEKNRQCKIVRFVYLFRDSEQIQIDNGGKNASQYSEAFCDSILPERLCFDVSLYSCQIQISFTHSSHDYSHEGAASNHERGRNEGRR